MVEEHSAAVVGYATGTASIQEVRAATQSAWDTIISDPKLRAAAAVALLLPEAELAGASAPPLQLRTGQSGTGTVDIAIMVVTYIGTDIVWGAFRSLAQDEVKRRVKALWSRVLAPAVKARLRDRNALGPENDIP